MRTPASTPDTTRGNKYASVAAELRRRVEEGLISHRLPTVAELADEFSVTPMTMHKALQVLKTEGLIFAIQGNGTFVTRLKRPRTYTIGLIGHNIPGGPLHQDLLRGVQEAAHQADHFVTAKGHGADPDKAIELIRHMTSQEHVDGLIVWPTALSRIAPEIRYALEQDLPVVVVPEADPLIYTDCSTVSNTDPAAATQVMVHLISLGHTEIGFVGDASRPAEDAASQRYSHYCRAMQSAGLPVHDPILLHAYDSTADITLPPELGTRLGELDAVFCATDHLAVAIIGCCARHGIRVPTDLAVAGYDNTAVARLLGLTSVEQHFDRIGEMAVQVLLNEVEELSLTPVHRHAQSDLVIRGSTATHPRTEWSKQQ